VSKTKYDWALYGLFKENRIRRPLGLLRALKRIRYRLFPDRSPRLIYTGYRVQFPEISFEYETGSRTYTNRLFLDTYKESDLKSRDPKVIDAILTNIGMAFIPSMFCLGNFRDVQVDALPLDESSRAFFEDIFLKGLGEWHFREGLPVAQRIRITSTNSSAPHRAHATNPEERALLLNGGGKDSAVAVEVVKRLGMPFHWLTIDPNPTRRSVIRLSGHDHAIEMRVEFDPALREASRYERPDPWLILYSFVSLLPAYLQRCKYVFVANEYSANFGNIKADGLEVNHQFCKSHEYEAALDRYVKSHIITDVSYLSLLRPLYELRIGRLFANFPQYFGSFISCNVGLNAGRWCKECAKCAFISICLAPFVSPEQIAGIFGENPLDRNAIRSWIVDLTVGKMKPWDCVGTREECTLALALTLAKYPNRDFQGWPGRQLLEKCCRDVDVTAYRKEYLESFNEPHLLPEPLSRRVREIADSLS
jgi:hypothetical protein